MSKLIRVLRVIEYVGDRQWVEDTVAKSIHGTKQITPTRSIRASTIGTYPDYFTTTTVEVCHD